MESQLTSLAEEIKRDLENGDVPKLAVPKRTKSNIKFDESKDVWSLGNKTTERTGKRLSGARKLLKMVYTIEFLKSQLQDGQSSTLRELYYLSESWEHEDAHFNGQDESNEIVEDLEILSGVTREDLNMHPEESGASLMGPLKIREQTRRGERDIHLQKDVGESGYTIPNDPDTIEFLDHDINFVLCVETGGMRDRLIENGFDEQWGALITHLKGQPSRATKRFIKRTNDELDLPVLVFCDGDPWSYRIFGAVAYGSIKSAHLSGELVTPEARYLGIEPSDIRDYDLPSDPLSEKDINALENELQDPRFQSDYWRDQIELQLEIGKKAEQQSLAKYGLEFVTDTYLPEKLNEMGI